MLLRRINLHLKQQNWTAVILDFLVVVLGIVVGLQITDWNEQRKDNAKEQQYLSQIYRDFGVNIEKANALVAHHDERVNDSMYAISKIIKQKPQDDEEAERFKWAVLTLKQRPPLMLEMGGYNALIAAGDFALIRDNELRNLFIRIDSAITTDKEMLDIFAGQDWNEQDQLRIGKTLPHPSGRGLAFEVDYDYVANHPQSLSVFSAWRRSHATLRDYRSYLAKLFTDARERIKVVNNQPSDTENSQ
ncbi:hypothetical protein [Thalassotalea sp. Y01]|uniref:hypothetical protein n=1 Tax=Thalassotalea sp. Y01 TaxID=2729613 RepID=UPI00145F6379|nr:hypothetical protein [Thalassotalea sp. Y01]NMP15602.1 hypothetical protein [Thalassotalea sp. Y01]